MERFQSEIHKENASCRSFYVILCVYLHVSVPHWRLIRNSEGEARNLYRILIWKDEEFCYMSTDTDGEDIIKIVCVSELD
jgi:hypothetical protein